MDEKDELRRRRRAIRLWLKGTRPKDLLRRVERSWAWFTKWRQRFQRQGLSGLKSRSRRPRRTPTACPRRLVRLIVPTRRRLVRQRAGLVGPRAIRRERRRLRWGRHLPSIPTIQRVLRAPRWVAARSDRPPVYVPRPLNVVEGRLQALDWTCRYLETGPKVYAFPTLNLRTRACAQTIAVDQSSRTVIAHVLTTWKTLGIPRCLPLDNDAAFHGGYKVKRVIGQVVRLSLDLGIELIFLPVAEPERNGDIEQLNRLWGHAFFNQRRCRSGRHVARASPAFVSWSMTRYAPPRLGERTPQAAQRAEPRRRLAPPPVAQRPDPWPITAGRIHFIRQIALDGTIALLNETWPVSRRLAGKYVWATITTQTRCLEIWSQRSAQHEWQLRKTFVYDLLETVARLKPEFACGG